MSTEPTPSAPSLAEPPAMEADLLEAAIVAGLEATRLSLSFTSDDKEHWFRQDRIKHLNALAARLRTYATETLPALERDARRWQYIAQWTRFGANDEMTVFIVMHSPSPVDAEKNGAFVDELMTKFAARRAAATPNETGNTP